jgi:hypothetical protein
MENNCKECLICGGSKRSGVKLFDIGEVFIPAHPDCKQRVPDNFILWFLEDWRKYKRS